MTKRAQRNVSELRDPANDLDLIGLLDQIEQEEMPEQLLALARQLQDKLALCKQQMHRH